MQAVGSTYAPGWWLKLTNVSTYCVVIFVNVASGQGWLGASNAEVSRAALSTFFAVCLSDSCSGSLASELPFLYFVYDSACTVCVCQLPL